MLTDEFQPHRPRTWVWALTLVGVVAVALIAIYYPAVLLPSGVLPFLPIIGQVSSPYARRFLLRTSDPATGTEGQVYWKSDTNALRVYDGSSWTSVGGAGDVAGPASSTDNAVARFDSTTGKVIQNSGASVDDTGKLTAAGAIFTAGVMPSAGNSWPLGDAGAGKEWFQVSARSFLVGTSTGFAQILFGNGSPEGSVSAGVGSIYLRLNGGAGTALYVKESGSGDTGWVGK